MTVQDMEYDIKLKLNRLDSNAFRGLLIPELDWKINEAHDVYVNNAISPKRPNGLAFEINERITTDIAPLVVQKTIVPVNSVVKLPTDYRNFVKADASVKKGSCILSNKVWVVQHEDLAEYDYFSIPSFEWQEANATFESDGIVIDADGDIQEVYLTYVKKHPYVHNASGFTQGGGTYRLPSGELLQGSQDSILPAHTHNEIVNIAVALIAIDMEHPQAAALQQKLKINQ